MPIGSGGNINRGAANIAKNISSAASRSIQDQRQVHQKVEKQVQTQKQKTAQEQKPTQTGTKDNVSIAKQQTQTEIFKKQEKQLKKQSTPQQSQQTGQAKESKGVFKAWLKGVMQNKAAQQARQATQYASKSSTMSPQTLAKTWMQMDSKTLVGLEKFLQAEFAQFPDNYQVFMKLQMIKMVKDAKRMLEEHKILTQAAAQGEGGEEAALIQHAAQSMSALGLAFYFIRKKSKLKKKGKLKKTASILGSANMQETEQLDDNEKMFKTLQQAEQFLKQAEAELRQAILFGGDRQQLEEIMNDIIAVYSAIARMTKQEKNSMQES